MCHFNQTRPTFLLKNLNGPDSGVFISSNLTHVLSATLFICIEGQENICNGDRLAGAALLAPVVNYWWDGLPENLSGEAYKQQKVQDQWAVRVAHYVRWLTYWWNTQTWLPGSSVIAHSPDNLSHQDRKLIPRLDEKSYVVCIKGFKVCLCSIC